MANQESISKFFRAVASGERQPEPRKRGLLLPALTAEEVEDEGTAQPQQLGEQRRRAATAAAVAAAAPMVPSQEMPAKRQKSAWVYLFFVESDGDTAHRYHCKFSKCRGKLYSAITTANLHSHLRSKHSAACKAIEKCIGQGREPDASFAEQLMAAESRGTITLPTLLAQSTDKRVARAIKLLAWLVVDAKPFATVSSRYFQEFLAEFDYKPPSARHLLRYLGILQDTIDTVIQMKLSRLEFVSVSVDEWSSANLLSFLSLAYQGFDDNMQLVQCEDLIKFPPPHTAERYEEFIWRRINYRASDKVTLISLTADGASAIRNACRAIVGHPDTVWCLAHQLQLAINDVIVVASNPYQSVIKKVRLWVLAIRTHLLPREMLTEAEKLANVKQQQLVLDVATRWDSTLDMTSVFLKLWPIVSRIADQGILDTLVDGDQDITSDDIAQLTAVANVLKEFAKVTKVSSAQKFTTIVYVPQMIQHLLHMLDVDAAHDTTLTMHFTSLLRDALVSRMRSIMQSPSPQLLAAMLDPLQHALPFLGDNDALRAAVNEEMIRQIVLLNKERTLSSGEIVAATTEEQARVELHEYHELCERNAATYKAMLHSNDAWSAEAHTKLCKWWTEHRDYKRLYRTARALLAVQATSTPNERAFSAAGEQHALKRRSMSPDTLTAVCMIAGNVDESMTLDQLVVEARRVALERSGTDPFADLDGDEDDEVGEIV